jgi:ACS family D-galactonate transporter-like MFS transporter
MNKAQQLQPPLSTALAVDQQRRTSVRWRIFAVIFVLTVINLIDRTALSIAMPTIAKEFSLSPSMQGLILSSFFWTYALMQIPGGWLIDRFGPRWMVSASTVLWGLFQTLAAFTTNGVSLLLTRLGLGASEAPLFPSGGKLNALWLSPRERSRGAVLMDSGSPLGAALGGIVISWLILTMGSWRLAFLAAGLVTLAMGYVAWRYLRDNPAAHPSVNAEELAHIQQVEASSTVRIGAGLRSMPSWRTIACLGIGRASWAMIFFGLLTWGPSYLSQSRGLDLKQMGAATFFIFLAGSLGSLTGGFLADALQRAGLRRSLVLKTMLAISGLVTLGAFLVLPTVSAPVSAVALLSATTFVLMWGSLYWSFPALLAAPDKAGLMGGVMNFAGSLGGISTPIIVGMLLQATGNYLAVLQFFAGCAAVFVIGSLTINLNERSAA